MKFTINIKKKDLAELMSDAGDTTAGDIFVEALTIGLNHLTKKKSKTIGFTVSDDSSGGAK